MSESKINSKLLQTILHDPLLMQQLSDRVYQLLRENQSKQIERSQGYGSRI